jgi:phenylpropionate dioxygenase-like ring-hydroxylating dioxygenase large terminal subunit
MLKNKWYIVLSSEEVKKNRITKARRFGIDIVFWRDSKNEVHAIDAKCPHRGADLGLGKIVNDCVQCPYHGFLYDGNGIAVLIPSLGKSAKINPNYRVRSFKVKEFMNFIFMWYGDKEPEEEIKWLEGIDNSYSFSTIKETWEVNYTRAIENQLDVSHLPFVHRTTIGRGNRTLVNGPIVELEGDVLNVWVFNEVDRGQLPKKQNEIKKDECTGRLQLILPNYWQNIISDKLRVMAAFVPEDENRTILYVRLYQKFIKIPLISSLINYIFMRFNRVVLKQDRGVVTSQIPKYSDISNKELLVQADAPILLYRKYLHENSKE